MDSLDLLEPRKLYDSKLKEAHHNNATEYWDNLAKKGLLNIEENSKTCDEHYKTMKKYNDVTRHAKMLRGWRTFSIVMSIITIVVGIILIYFKATNQVPEEMWYFILIGILCILAGIGGIVLPCVLMNKHIKSADEEAAKLKKIADDLKNKAYTQMAGLNSLYDWGVAPTLVSKTTPLIQMDKVFNPARYMYLQDNYGFTENENADTSTVLVQSGTILGNPFIIERDFCTHMVNHTYSGSLVIHWTTTHTDSEGRTYTQNHTETLHAYVTKPKPEYYYETWLIYGNGAAPKLSFSRVPSDANKMNDKEIAKKAKNFEKELRKRAEEAIKNNKSFTAMTNNEFEYLFNALNRDNEVEFRLLFTPLAQKSMIDLIKSKTPYGDDFFFEKAKCLNFIQSAHSQNADYEGNPAQFIHFDNRISKQKFVKFHDEFFKNIFFDLAPLLCIPLYQQYKAPEYIYADNYKGNVTTYESEVIANKYNPSAFMHPDCKTDTILKAEFIKKEGKSDIVNIHSFGYDKIRHIDYIPVRGGDGYMHNVPVEWFEYIDVEMITPMGIQNVGVDNVDAASKYDKASSIIGNNGIISQRGLFSSILNDGNLTWNSEELNKLFSQQEEK